MHAALLLRGAAVRATLGGDSAQSAAAMVVLEGVAVFVTDVRPALEQYTQVMAEIDISGVAAAISAAPQHLKGVSRMPSLGAKYPRLSRQ